ncbi:MULTISPECIES: AraC family transcriptional regulator [Pseudomonas]|uniref:AraC family transcriptional regulator n=1 Tax=Pseudomonas TaxID=286 RepID=UPI000CD57D25|nr:MULTISPECIES: AraC family transcriptional regulator [Pseudomonas]MPQ70069.1 helix-turn-helix domain-containing protein [Pseudomonas sp. MWU12-2323]RBH57146.1 AraC family transcriptional regulator [Pseudomonas sp. MWU13-2860]
MDRLSTLLTHFGIAADTFHSGLLRGNAEVDGLEPRGHVHLLKSGRVNLESGGKLLRIEEPSLILIPRPLPHRLVASKADAAELVCAALRFDGGIDNPLSVALSDTIVMPLAAVPMLEGNLEWLFAEAFAEHCGREAVMNRLFELMVIQFLRHMMAYHSMTTGMMSGLADLRLARAMTMMHNHPERPWTVADLAQESNMSRASFAAHFHKVVGQTPADYVLSWRVSLAQKRLREGRPIALIADEVGYESPSALARAFRRKIGESPREWLARQSA